MAAEDSTKKLKRKKNTKKKREENSDMGGSQPAQKEGNSYRASKEGKKKKKKSSVDSKVDCKTFELHNMEDETLELSGGKRKVKKLRDKKREKCNMAEKETEEFDTSNIDEVEDRSSGRDYAQSELSEDKLQKSRKKKRKNVESINNVGTFKEKDDVKDEASGQGNGSKPEDHFANSGELNKGHAGRNSEAGKLKKPEKKKKKRQLVANDLSSDNLLEKRVEDAEEEEVYQMSSGDEDYSKGMKKWVTQYYQSRPGLKELQERIDDFIMAHEAKEAQARAEREAQAAEGGWTVVVQHKGRKKTTDAESGIAVGSVAQAAVLDKMGKKKNKEVGLDFYRFQKREARRNEIMMLQSKFEQDKKRIQQMRAARKFRPY